jgi:hypothetical protein
MDLQDMFARTTSIEEEEEDEEEEENAYLLIEDFP